MFSFPARALTNIISVDLGISTYFIIKTTSDYKEKRQKISYENLKTSARIYIKENPTAVNELFTGQEYENLLSNKVVATGGKFNSSFASSGVNLSIPAESQDKIEFVYEGTKIVGLKALENDVLMPKEIAEQSGIKTNHVSKVLSKLRSKELIEVLDDSVRKGRLYRLTETGEEIVGNLN